jgi:hypothetical protein
VFGEERSRRAATLVSFINVERHRSEGDQKSDRCLVPGYEVPVYQRPTDEDEEEEEGGSSSRGRGGGDEETWRVDTNLSAESVAGGGEHFEWGGEMERKREMMVTKAY